MKNARKPLSLILALVMTLSLTAFAPVLAAEPNPDPDQTQVTGQDKTDTTTDGSGETPEETDKTKADGSGETDKTDTTTDGSGKGGNGQSDAPQADKAAVPAVAAAAPVAAPPEATPAPTVNPIPSQIATIGESGGSYTITAGTNCAEVYFKPTKTGLYTFAVPSALQTTNASGQTVSLNFSNITITEVVGGGTPPSVLTANPTVNTGTNNSARAFYLESGKTYKMKHEVDKNAPRDVSCNMTIAYPTTGSATLPNGGTYYYNYVANEANVYTFKALVTGATSNVSMSVTTDGDTAATSSTTRGSWPVPLPIAVDTQPAGFNGTSQQIVNSNQQYIGSAVYLNKGGVAVIKVQNTSGAQVNVNVSATAAPAASGTLTEPVVVSNITGGTYTTYRKWSPTDTGLYTVKISTNKDGKPAGNSLVPTLYNGGSGNSKVKYFENDALKPLAALKDNPGHTALNTNQYLFYVSKAADYFLQIANVSVSNNINSTITIEKVPTIMGAGSANVKAPVGMINVSGGVNYVYDFAYLTFIPNTTGWYTFEADGGELVVLNETDLLTTGSEQVAFPDYINIGTVFAPDTWANNLKYQEAAKKMTASGYFEQGKEYIMRYIPRPTDAVKFSQTPDKLTDYSGTITANKANFPAIATLGTTIGTTSVTTYGTGTAEDDSSDQFISYFTFTPKANATSTDIIITAGLKTGMAGYAKVTGITIYDEKGVDISTLTPTVNFSTTPSGLAVSNAVTTAMAKADFTGGKTYYIAVETDAPTTCTVKTQVTVKTTVNGKDPATENATVILKDSTGAIIKPEAGAPDTYKLPYGGKYTVTAAKAGNTPKSVTITADSTQTVNIDLVKTQTISVTLSKASAIATSGSYCNIAKTDTQVNGTTTTVTVDVTAKDLAPATSNNTNGCWLDFTVAKPSGASVVVGWNEYTNTNAVNINDTNATIKKAEGTPPTDTDAYSFEAIPKDGQVKNGWIAVTTTSSDKDRPVTSTTVYILRFADNYASGNITVRPTSVSPNDYYYIVSDTEYKSGLGKVPEESVGSPVADLAKSITLGAGYKYSSPMSAQAASMVGTSAARTKYVNDAIKLVDQLYANMRPDDQYAKNDPALRLGDFAFVKLTNPESGGKEYKYVPWSKTDYGSDQTKFPTGLGSTAAYSTADYFDRVVAVPYMDVEMTAYTDGTEFGFKATPHVMILVTDETTANAIIASAAAGKLFTDGKLVTQTNPDTNKTWTHSELNNSKEINAIVVEDREVVSASTPLGLVYKAESSPVNDPVYAIQGDTYIYKTETGSSNRTFTSTHGLKPSDFVITKSNKAVASIPSRVEGEIAYTSLKAAIEDAKTGDIIYFLHDTDGTEISVNASVGSDVSNLTIVNLKGEPLTKANIVINGTRVTNGTYRGGTGSPASSWNITFAYSANGSVYANPNPASPGQTVSLTATPNNGYKLASIYATTANGASVTLTPVSYNSNAYTFVMPADGSRVNVSASFVGGGVNLVQRAGGVLSYSVNGSTVTVTASPSAGYALSSLSVVSSTGAVIYPTAVSANVYTFTMPANATVTVTPTWTGSGITATGGVSVIPASGGTVTASSANPRVGDPVLLTVTPYNGYEMNSVMVRGVGDTPVVTKKVSNGTYRFIMPSGGVTVTPTWRLSGSSVPYTDYIPSWAKTYVDYTYTRNLMQGIGSNTFAGTNNVDRASMWTILSRMDGHYPKTSGYPWYSEPRDWAVTQVNAGQALSDGTNPSGNVTREQVATMLYRYAKSMGKDVSKESGLGGFTDGGKVSSWASDAVRWACGAGIIQGKDGARLDPQGAATRNEIAKMISTFCTSQGL